MTAKRKISVRKVLQLVVTVVVTTGSIMALLSASSVQKEKYISGMDIYIRNSQYHFIDEQLVKDMLLTERNVDLGKMKLSKLDVHQMESVLDANPWVADAQVFVDNRQKLHVYVTQRVPVARLFEQNGNSYYLDHTLKAMPLSGQYIHYTTVVTNVPVLNNDSLDNDLKGRIVSLVREIEKDSFWRAQVSQVIVTDDRKFELVPVLGKHRILFGDTVLMHDKFTNLFAFYKKVLNKIGWNKYDMLDLRFAGQVVASPALPWKKPEHNGMGNMDWVKSVIGDDPKPVDSDTTDVVITNTIVNAVPPQATMPPAATAPAKATANSVEKPMQVKQPEVRPQAAPLKPARAEVKKTVETKKPVQQPLQAVKTEAKKQQSNNKEKNNNEPAPKYIYEGQ